MNRILLAVTILGAGTGGFLTARQSTTQLRHAANATKEAWLAQAQLLAAAQKEQADLHAQVREQKEALAQGPTPSANPLWSALQTNNVDHLSPELRERLLQELELNWRSAGDFIVVSKDALREAQMQAVDEGQLSEVAAVVLAMTPTERARVEAALKRSRTDFNHWALAHTQRIEPKEDVVAQYALERDAAMSLGLSNTFFTEVFAALGRQRTELLLPSVQSWMALSGFVGGDPMTMTIKRYLNEKEQRLKLLFSVGQPGQAGGSNWGDLPQCRFPPAFRPVFPNGWSDVAKREGFELPPPDP